MVFALSDDTEVEIILQFTEMSYRFAAGEQRKKVAGKD